MTAVVAVIAGALAALTLDAAFRRGGVARGRTWWSWSLLIAALVYVGLAAASGGSLFWLAVEILGVSVSAPFVALGLRGSSRAVAFGWGLHALWDLLLHTPAATPYVPGWYPWLCLGFDMLVAGLLFTNYAEPPGHDES